MTETLTSEQFCYWIKKMDMTYKEAGYLLGVSISTIEGYAYGVFKIPEQQANTCRLLFRFKMKKLREECHTAIPF